MINVLNRVCGCFDMFDKQKLVKQPDEKTTHKKQPTYTKTKGQLNISLDRYTDTRYRSEIKTTN